MNQLRVKYAINNNAVVASDFDNHEFVLLGKGIGFSMKAHDLVDSRKIEKRFLLEKKENQSRFLEVIKNMRQQDLDFFVEMIDYIKEEIDVEMSESLYITLVDHFNFTIERYREKNQLRNILLNEIRRFYAQEYQIAKQVITKISEKYQIDFLDDEIAFVAMHIVNAKLGEADSQKSLVLIEMIETVVKIINEELEEPLEEESLNYDRLVTHIRYFAQRYLYHKQWLDDDEMSLTPQVVTHSAYRIIEKIVEIFEQKYQLQVLQEEKNYLALHIYRLIRK